MKDTKKSPKRATSAGKTLAGFSAEERAAMKERVRELKAEAAKADGEAELLAAVAKMREPDRAMAKKVHAIVKATAPDLSPKTWYGMPAYARDGKIVLFFRERAKFKERYAMLGFNDSSNLDEGAMWPIAFALTKLTPSVEADIRALVKQAVS